MLLAAASLRGLTSPGPTYRHRSRDGRASGCLADAGSHPRCLCLNWTPWVRDRGGRVDSGEEKYFLFAAMLSLFTQRNRLNFRFLRAVRSDFSEVQVIGSGSYSSYTLVHQTQQLYTCTPETDKYTGKSLGAAQTLRTYESKKFKNKVIF